MLNSYHSAYSVSNNCTFIKYELSALPTRHCRVEDLCDELMFVSLRDAQHHHAVLYRRAVQVIERY